MKTFRKTFRNTIRDRIHIIRDRRPEPAIRAENMRKVNNILPDTKDLKVKRSILLDLAQGDWEIDTEFPVDAEDTESYGQVLNRYFTSSPVPC